MSLRGSIDIGDQDIVLRRKVGRVRVEVKHRCLQFRIEKQREFVAERMPPADPIASRWLLESRNHGKIERSLMVSGL